MSDTMTLEALRESVRDHTVRNRAGVIGVPKWAREAGAAIDAAIQERDELRKTERTARCEMIPDVVRWHERAEKAEAELAALKKRIADAPTTLPLLRQVLGDGRVFATHPAPLERLPVSWSGKRVRLLVEEDDA